MLEIEKTPKCSRRGKSENTQKTEHRDFSGRQAFNLDLIGAAESAQVGETALLLAAAFSDSDAFAWLLVVLSVGINRVPSASPSHWLFLVNADFVDGV